MKQSSVPVVVLSARQDEAELVNRALREAGHRAQCFWCNGVERLEETLGEAGPHLILYFADGLDVPIGKVAALRQRHSPLVPLLALRATVDETAIAAALQAGAQDMVSSGQIDRLKAVATRELRTYRLERALDRTLQSANQYKAQLKSFMAGSIDAIAEIQEGIVVAANQAWADLLGHASPETTLGPIMDFIDAPSQAALKGALLASLKGRWDGTVLKIAALRHEGGSIPVEMTLERTIYDGDPAVKLTVVRPADRIEEPESVVEDSMHRDPVTGFDNRSHFVERLTEWLKKGGGPGSRALALVRIDKFREIKAEIGTVASEQVIAAVAGMLRDVLGPHDVAGRFAGTTFAVMIDRGALRDVQAWAEHAISRVAESTIEAGGKSIAVTCTAGIAEVGPDTSDIDALIATAERAKQSGRENGGDRVVVEEASDESTQIKRLDALWVHQVKSALVDNRFRLVHLGIATLSGKPQRMFDTVLRMIDQQGDEVAASQFMDAARRNGLARPIDRWVVGSSVAYCARHDCDLLFVKLGEDSLADDEIVDWTVKLCAESGVDPSRLCVQIGESDATQFLKQTQTLAQRLKQARIRFAIEHFGVGRDPLRLLSQLPADFVKIDGSLMQSVARDPALQEKVRAFVGAARKQNAATIAERVDDANTMAVLFQLGIAYIQGHYVHEPEVVLSESA